MTHIVLLGDSIFDNAVYVPGGPPVIQQLRSKLPAGWQATLLAIDGNVTEDVDGQLERVASDATHLIVSVGGNDALNNINILSESARSTAEVLSRLAEISERFQRTYSKMLRIVLGLNLPTAVCTVYFPNFSDQTMQRLATVALTIFNDVIIREAFDAGVPLIDLRLVCNHPEDYANAIEPSVAGGEKITHAILRLVTQHRFESGRTEVFI